MTEQGLSDQIVEFSTGKPLNLLSEENRRLLDGYVKKSLANLRLDVVQEFERRIEEGDISEATLNSILNDAESMGIEVPLITERVAKAAATNNYTNLLLRIVSNRTEPFEDIWILISAASFASKENLETIIPLSNMNNEKSTRAVSAALQFGKTENAKVLIPHVNTAAVISHLKTFDRSGENLSQQFESLHQEYLLKQKNCTANLPAKSPASGL